jgi:hypothetical protein
MSHGSSEQLVMPPDPVSPPSPRLFASEIVDASYLGTLYLHALDLTSGMALKLRIFSHSPTRVIGSIMTIADGLQFNRIWGGLSTLYRMECCLTPLYIRNSMPMASQSIRMYVYFVSISNVEANIYHRTITRLWSSGLHREPLLASISIQSTLHALMPLLIRFYDGTLDKLSWLT